MVCRRLSAARGAHNLQNAARGAALHWSEGAVAVLVVCVLLSMKFFVFPPPHPGDHEAGNPLVGNKGIFLAYV